MVGRKLLFKEGEKASNLEDQGFSYLSIGWTRNMSLGMGLSYGLYNNFI